LSESAQRHKYLTQKYTQQCEHQRRLRGDLIEVYKILSEKERVDKAEFFSACLGYSWIKTTFTDTI